MKQAAKKMGRPTLFDKDGPDVHGRVSKGAGDKLKMYRAKLAKLSGWSEEKISDGDVIEFIIRGEVSTKLKLKGEL